ncbi:MAG TPA: circularly permuted type 2 ATP-grasp protein [Propioniciclava sp.]|uniref:circularly permuted type 2 ATP-grasp protein n=1 Tax=Propioniciclava sp. TaxID=2038686 RepID=UPI002C245C08|nr:circularly permuted type 2 ATP-grasp protein [Propioniciclava sp.]HRL49230.1 circularly permuted type 2 ATP-grasp protein [Propioniciclava sp.]HRL79123.1 circularly permuted type 2 ATP-grasp protein [Propioniciclava sp.]
MNAAASVPGLTPGELRQRVSAVAGMIEGDGIVAGSDADGRLRPLRVDPGPLILGAVEWAGLERALAQRATLLDLVLADLYGPRALVTRGLVPPQIVVGHPGFFAAAAGIPTRGALLTTAADLGKDADGQWRVLADRTQRPLGAGYAMAIRRVIARALAPVHRATPLRRLRGYFDALRSGLLELGATASEAPRVVMLRSPEEEEAAFDEMFAATLLGFPVVVADDLALRGGRLWLTTTGRDEPVDVLVRRVDARRADPLDLAPGSDAGIPGLVEATRRGNVRVVNPVGAGVLENPALGAFLPAISRALLDEDLLLPSARTWWCGEDAGRRHAADHLDDIVLAPLASLPGRGRVFTAELTRDERAALWARVESEPWAWCAQEVLPPWDVELVGTPGTAARAGLLRTFTLTGVNGATVMPGGLARFAAQDDARRVPSLADAVAKDVWVLDGDADRAEAPAGKRDRDRIEVAAATVGPVPLPPRAAEDLYWFGRYVERAESTARLLLVADDLVEDHLTRPGTIGHTAMVAMLGAVDAVTSVQRYRGRTHGPDTAVAPVGDDPVRHLRDLVFEPGRHGSVRFSAARANQAASRVRELLSLDAWLVLSRLQRTLVPGNATDEDLPGVLAAVIEACLALSGMSAEGLVRDASWAFHDAGRRVERAQETVRVLRRTLPAASTRGASLVREATLRARESLLSYRRRRAEGGRSRTPLATALELLLLDETNPRSVAYQLDRLHDDLRHAPSPEPLAALRVPTLGLAGADATALALAPDALASFLEELEAQLRTVSGSVEAACFPHRAPQHSFEERR